MSTRKHLLIADDDPHMCTIVGMLFPRDRFTVTAAGNGLQARELVRETHYDVIITDIRMPGMNGDELLDEVMQQDRTQKVIMISGNNMDEDDLKERGAFGVLRKPFQLDHIRSLVQAALADGRQAVLAGC